MLGAFRTILIEAAPGFYGREYLAHWALLDRHLMSAVLLHCKAYNVESAFFGRDRSPQFRETRRIVLADVALAGTKFQQHLARAAAAPRPS